MLARSDGSGMAVKGSKGEGEMRLRNLVIAALASMALLGIGAGSAQATAHWSVEGNELSGSETVKISGGSWTLTSTVLGTPVELTAEAVACGSTCTISGAGESAGALKFTGVKVVKPANCTAGNPGKTTGTITTNALKDQVIMDPKSASGPVFDKFTPTSGTKLAEIEFQGATCALGEVSVGLQGSAGGEFSNATGVDVAEPTLTFGSSQQTTSESSLTLGTAAATLAGKATEALSGENAGALWGTYEVAWMSRKRVGGEATEGARGTCEFTKLGQECHIEFKNITARTLAVVSTELRGPEANARYSKVEEGCPFNLGLGECIDKLKVTKFVAGGINDYCMTVVDKANGVEHFFICAILRM